VIAIEFPHLFSVVEHRHSRTEQKKGRPEGGILQPKDFFSLIPTHTCGKSNITNLESAPRRRLFVFEVEAEASGNRWPSKF
jgi:hypothetical protein